MYIHLVHYISQGIFHRARLKPVAQARYYLFISTSIHMLPSTSE